LNAVLWDDWQTLDPRWNLLASHAGRRREESDGSQAWRQPGIVHFAGRMKPWKAPVGGPFNEPYQEALAQVRPHFPPDAPTLSEHLQSLYDRHLRSALYPFERYLWKQRLI
jgi:lipopolysaccharide biosynthesis glycosyltransferase